MQDALDDFLHHCRIERRLAPLTCSAYERDVRACMRFLQAKGVRDWSAVRSPDLRRLLADEAARRPAPASQARTVTTLKGFFRFLVENEEIERNPAQVLRTPKKREALPDVLDSRELARLLRAVERDDVWERRFHGKRERDRLILALFAYAGLRRSELLGLDWDDVDLERRLLHVRRAKGGRQRVVPIHPALAPLFLDYLPFRARDPEPALFVGVQGRQIQELLGHKHLDSTQRYTRASPRTTFAARSSGSTSSTAGLAGAPLSQVHSGGGIWTDIYDQLSPRRTSTARTAIESPGAGIGSSWKGVARQPPLMATSRWAKR
jgi:integrase/recombinase XerD